VRTANAQSETHLHVSQKRNEEREKKKISRAEDFGCE
jgi:hypothetical protein